MEDDTLNWTRTQYKNMMQIPQHQNFPVDGAIKSVICNNRTRKNPNQKIILKPPPTFDF